MKYTVTTPDGVVRHEGSNRRAAEGIARAWAASYQIGAKTTLTQEGVPWPVARWHVDFFGKVRRNG